MLAPLHCLDEKVLSFGLNTTVFSSSGHRTILLSFHNICQWLFFTSARHRCGLYHVNANKLMTKLCWLADPTWLSKWMIHPDIIFNVATSTGCLERSSCLCERYEIRSTIFWILKLLVKSSYYLSNLSFIRMLNSFSTKNNAWWVHEIHLYPFLPRFTPLSAFTCCQT